MLSREWSRCPVLTAFLPERSGAGEMLPVSSRFIISLPGQMGQSSAFSGDSCTVEAAGPGPAPALRHAGAAGSWRGESWGRRSWTTIPTSSSLCGFSKASSNGGWHLPLPTFICRCCNPEAPAIDAISQDAAAHGTVTSSSCRGPDPSWRKGSRWFWRWCSWWFSFGWCSLVVVFPHVCLSSAPAEMLPRLFSGCISWSISESRTSHPFSSNLVAKFNLLL